ALSRRAVILVATAASPLHRLAGALSDRGIEVIMAMTHEQVTALCAAPDLIGAIVAGSPGEVSEGSLQRLCQALPAGSRIPIVIAGGHELASPQLLAAAVAAIVRVHAARR